MLSLHQLRCFLTTYEQGILTAAADELGYAQPSVSEQIRALGAVARRRAVPPGRPGRRADDGGATSLRPHAERAVGAAEEARAGGPQR